MEFLAHLRNWFDAHRALAYALIRCFLGIALFIRGWLFVSDADVLMALVADQGRDWLFPMVLVHYVASAHILGGMMLALGLLTRIGALIQLPVLFGAVFFIHLNEGLFAPGQSLELSALVLFLLLVFAAFGSGPYALDEVLFRQEEEEEHALT